MNETTKQCSQCNQTKFLDCFTFNKHNNNYVSICKPCVSINTLKWQKQLFESNDPNDILEATFYKILQSSRSNAKTKNIPYSLSIQTLRDLYAKQHGKCYYTSVPMTLRYNNHTHRDPLLISLDRLNPSDGYSPTNTVLCCWGCNALKGQHTIETFYTSLATFYEGAKSLGKV